MNVRLLEPSDAPEWWRVRLESLENDPLAFGKSAEEHRASTLEAAANRFRDATEGSFHLGAFEDGKLIGMATFSRETGLKERHKGHIYGFYVTPAHRGAGVARSLLTELIERARQDASLEQILLAVANPQFVAHQLYRSFGFERYGTEPRALKVGSTYVGEILMILRLS